MKIISIFLLSLLVCACASNLNTIPNTVYVDKPSIVEVPCKIKTIEKPIMPFQTCEISDPLGVKINKMLSEIEIRKAYETQLEAGVKSCQ